MLKKGHYSLQVFKTGRETAALDGIDVCDFDNADFLDLLYNL